MPSQSEWDRSAIAYDRFERKWHHYGRVAEKLVGPLKLDRGSKVLELASGTGACTLILSRNCPDGSVVCVEASSGMLRLARKNLRRAGCSNVTLVKGDVARLPSLVSGRFDCVVCNSAFWQFSDPRGLLMAISSIMKPKGVLAFNLPIWSRTDPGASEFHRVVSEVLKRHGVDPVEYWEKRKPTDYPALLRSAGFGQVKVVKYTVPIELEARNEWRRIPAFKDRRRGLVGLRRRMSYEIRRELREQRKSHRPLGVVEHPRWRLVTAKKKRLT